MQHPKVHHRHQNVVPESARAASVMQLPTIPKHAILINAAALTTIAVMVVAIIRVEAVILVVAATPVEVATSVQCKKAKVISVHKPVRKVSHSRAVISVPRVVIPVTSVHSVRRTTIVAIIRMATRTLIRVISVHSVPTMVISATLRIKASSSRRTRLRKANLRKDSSRRKVISRVISPVAATSLVVAISPVATVVPSRVATAVLSRVATVVPSKVATVVPSRVDMAVPSRVATVVPRSRSSIANKVTIHIAQ